MSREAVERFGCFGGSCEVRVGGGSAPVAAARARQRLLDWHDRFTRFTPDSELSRLNADARTEIPVSETMAALAEAVVGAAERSGVARRGLPREDLRAHDGEQDAGDEQAGRRDAGRQQAR